MKIQPPTTLHQRKAGRIRRRNASLSARGVHHRRILLFLIRSTRSTRRTRKNVNDRSPKGSRITLLMTWTGRPSLGSHPPRLQLRLRLRLGLHARYVRACRTNPLPGRAKSHPPAPLPKPNGKTTLLRTRTGTPPTTGIPGIVASRIAPTPTQPLLPTKHRRPPNCLKSWTSPSPVLRLPRAAVMVILQSHNGSLVDRGGFKRTSPNRSDGRGCRPSECRR